LELSYFATLPLWNFPTLQLSNFPTFPDYKIKHSLYSLQAEEKWDREGFHFFFHSKVGTKRPALYTNDPNPNVSIYKPHPASSQLGTQSGRNSETNPTHDKVSFHSFLCNDA
jgi:hypothetical protein